MSRSSEDVLLIVTQVKHKKTNGSLYLMGQRVAFMPETRDSFAISHMYTDIKAQRISPDSKEKVQLQIILHDGGANTFHFANPGGRDAQLADREGAKELLQQLLPKFRRKLDSELEEKNRMLHEDSELYQLYKDLVMSEVITADEFWAQATSQRQASDNKESQEVGISPAFMVDIKPEADGCNGLRYNLTSDLIESIFRTYPAVKKTHADNVPDKISEKEFWTRFFQSHYFHRDRINVGNKDLFAQCAKNDEQEMQEEIATQVNDVLIDLTAISDSTLDEGYGNANEDKSINPSNVSMIHRFNHHSTMVLKASQNNQDNSDQPPQKKAKIIEKVHYADLESPVSTSNTDLRLNKMDRYLQGPTLATASKYHTSRDVMQAASYAVNLVNNWKPNLTQCMNKTVALNALTELSPGGALMHGATQHLTDAVPVETREEVKHVYCAICELLRHFWACFPVSSKSLEEKVNRMYKNLENFNLKKVQPMKERLTSHHYNVDLMGHIEQLLSTAFNKYETWHNRKIGKKS